MAASIRLEGYALHAGVVTAVTLAREDGPITFGRGAHRVPLAALSALRTDWGVALTDSRGFTVDLTEHLLAAVGGLGIQRGLAVTIEGPELPILDGGARRFADALLHLEIAPGRPALVVKNPGALSFGPSSYEFAPGDHPELSVETAFDHPALATERAIWGGDRREFLESVAPARTFGFAAEASELWARGRGKLAALANEAAANDGVRTAFSDAVVVLDRDGPIAVPGQAPFRRGEVAQHKLLDLIGDLALYGGPPDGHIFARRPGHTASHRIIQNAITLGILSRR